MAFRLVLSFAAAGALAVLLLPEEWRALAWSALAVGLATLVAWGVVSIRSPLFGRARLGGTLPGAVALTFDDGPDAESTPAVLAVLARHGVAATFFVLGERVRAQPELARRCRDAGHELGNHSERHSPWLNFRLRGGMRRELEACQRAVAEACGSAPRFYRPPVGLRNPAVHPVCAALGLEVIGWQVRSLDKSRRAPEAVVRRVLERIRPGGIVLLHDGGQPAARAAAIADGILQGLARRGIRVVPLGVLLGRDPGTSSRLPEVDRLGIDR